MNRPQSVLLGIAALNAILILLFPPFDALAIGRGISTFDAFYFVFDHHANKVVNTDLLIIMLGWLALNVSAGLLLLKDRPSGGISANRRSAVLIFGAVNLALILLFPPFENYASMSRLSGTYFDGFYFVFGDKWQRRFYVPLLYLEILWVLVNTSVLWLAFRPSALLDKQVAQPAKT